MRRLIFCLKKRISGAPVVDSDRKFLSIFSKGSSLRVIINAAYVNLPDAGLVPFVDRHPPTITPGTDLLTICQTFLDQATCRLSVIEHRQLQGMVSRRDLMRCVRQSVPEKRCGHAELLYLSALNDLSKESVGLKIAH